MQSVNYISTSIFVYLGLLFGAILAYISKEELKSGKKYFILTQKIILLLIIISLLFYYNFGFLINLLLLTVLIILLSIFYYKKIHIVNYSKTIYLLLGVIFYLSSFNINLFIINSSLTFLYGFPTGSLLINLKKKNYFKILLNHISFVIIALLLFVFG
jgi:hypothetical protein